ncbi:hypothetical protein Syun_026032 [Stephania yunnanensis]|uniref:Uncharacterized protein n=1 Tax=Stephania yunnanensis TaxID=152371 RepID=A0AAP0EY56_9MAGN
MVRLKLDKKPHDNSRWMNLRCTFGYKKPNILQLFDAGAEIRASGLGKRLNQGSDFGRTDGCLKGVLVFGGHRYTGFGDFMLIVRLRLVPEVIYKRDWYFPSFLGPHTVRSRVKVKANLKSTRMKLPPLPTCGYHQAPSATSRRSFVASKAEEVKMVKEVLLLKSSSSSSSSLTTTTTTTCGLGGSAVLYLVSFGLGLRFSVLDH